MKVRPFSSLVDYKDVVSWWEHYKCEVPSKLDLPRTGLIVEEGGNKLAALWLIKTDSSIALLEWAVRNPKADRERVKLALETMFSQLTDRAGVEGFSSVFLLTTKNSIIDIVQKIGFNEGPEMKPFHKRLRR